MEHSVTSEQHDATAGGRLTLLLVEDDREVREAIAEYVREQCSDVDLRTVANGTAALEQVSTEPIDCVVAGFDTAGVDGVGFVTDVRSNAPGLPVLWLTEQDPGSIDEAALDAATTIVEQGGDSGNWAFLIEKVRGAVRNGGMPGEDEATFERLVETARDGLYRIDANGEFRYVNPSFASMLGYEQQELIGSHASEVMAGGELERGQALIQELMADAERESELMDMELVRNDGSRVTVEIHFAILTGSDGTYQGLMGVVRDITERKQRERELERQRARLEEFASVLGHDLRNPLAIATGGLDLLAEDDDSEELAMVEDALDRMERLVDDLLELARQGKYVESTEPVPLRAVVDRAGACLGDAADLRADVGGTTVAADRGRLVQVFENLFENAASHAGPAVTIRVGRLPDGRGFYVEDDGPGIPPAERDEVFDRGYSTSETGTGFGLSIVRNIVEAHGWSIAVTDGASGGARFEVTGVSMDPPECSDRAGGNTG